MKIQIDTQSKSPIYKQLVGQVERAVREGQLQTGELLESMNEMAARLNISKETVKKAYGILTEKGIVVPKQGKGFYVADIAVNARPQILVIFDKFSVYKQILFNAFAQSLGNKAELTILTHNQSLELLEYYLDTHLDLYDYYVITPHFSLNAKTQVQVKRQIARIPNRKLIMLDHLIPGLPGNFGAVYQDFENDIYSGLVQGLDSFEQQRSTLRVITLPQSLYGSCICKGVERFAREYGIPAQFLTQAPDDIHAGDTFLVLNSQLDAGLVDLVRRVQAAGLDIGTQVRIISYNESDMNELVLGGLTTVSTDFLQMGRLAADMILKKRLSKIHCDFRMIRRNTF